MDSTTANQLTYHWVTVKRALATENAHILEALRLGHGLLSREDFRLAIAADEMRILVISNDCAALVAWGMCEQGKVLNILTLLGTLDKWNTALAVLESAARHAGADVVMSVCQIGWKHVAEMHGYQTRPKLFVRKVL